jgi:hypothetical protein
MTKLPTFESRACVRMCPLGCHLDALRQEGDADQAEALFISSTALVPAGSRIALTVAVANETAKVAALPRKWSRSCAYQKHRKHCVD